MNMKNRKSRLELACAKRGALVVPATIRYLSDLQGELTPSDSRILQPRDTFSYRLISLSRLRRDSRWIQNRPLN